MQIHREALLRPSLDALYAVAAESSHYSSRSHVADGRCVVRICASTREREFRWANTRLEVGCVVYTRVSARDYARYPLTWFPLTFYQTLDSKSCCIYF